MGTRVSTQSGTATIANGSSSVTVTLATAVTRANSWAFARGVGVDSTVTNSEFRWSLNAGGTQITFTRGGSTTDLVIDYDIIEDTGFTAQYVSVSMGAAVTVDTTITAVDLSRTIAIPLGLSRSSTSRGRDDYAYPTLTSTTNLRVTMDATGASTVSVLVLQFDADIITSVNQYIKALTANTGSQTITSVNTAKSLVIPAGFTCTTSVVNSTEFHSFGLDSSTSVGFESYATPGGTMTYAFWVVEFANLAVAHGSQTTASATPTISLGSTPSYPGLIIGGAYGISTTDNADDGYDRDRFRGSQSSGTWTLTRTTADDSKLRYCTWDWATLRATAAAFAAAVTATATATAALTTEIQLAAAPAAVSAATGALTTAIQFAAASTATATATADLTTAIQLAATPTGIATATAALSTGDIVLDAAATATASATADLTTAIQLAAAPSAVSAITADLTTAIWFSATLAATSTATAALTTGGTYTPNTDRTATIAADSRIATIAADSRIASIGA
jgi:hypothetical protein